MVLFLLIPLGLVVLTIVLAPLLALAVAPDREGGVDVDERLRLPWGTDPTAVVPVVAEADRERHRVA